MTTKPITTERLQEIAALCGSGNVYSATAAIPELLAEVARLQSMLDEAQAVAWRTLGHNASLRDELDHARTYSPFSAKPCPLCEYADGKHTKPCAMHARMDEQSETIARLRSDLDHATAHDGDHLSKASRRMVETVLAVRDALRQDVARLQSEVTELLEQRDAYRDRAQQLANRVTALEDGLREALGHWRYPQLTHGEKARKDEIWSLVYPIDVTLQGAP